MTPDDENFLIGLLDRANERDEKRDEKNSTKMAEMIATALATFAPPRSEPMQVAISDASSSSTCFCHKCGKPLRPDANFCHSCGTPVYVN